MRSEIFRVFDKNKVKELDMIKLKKNTQLNGTISFMFIHRSSASSDYI